jgi:predicted transposase/invertase (TIGR01784 family)
MNKEIFSPFWDFVFALLFGDQRNIAILSGFLKAVLDLPSSEYSRLTIVNPFLKRMFKRDKLGIVDVRLTTKSGRVIHIELQVNKLSNMRSRILYYLSKLVSEQLKWGENYNKIHQVISIVVCDHELMEEEESYINKYELRNKKTGKLFTDLLEVIILELPKLPEKTDGQSAWPWLKFLKGKTNEG